MPEGTFMAVQAAWDRHCFAECDGAADWRWCAAGYMAYPDKVSSNVLNSFPENDVVIQVGWRGQQCWAGSALLLLLCHGCDERCTAGCLLQLFSI
jgi:hypothetical protein